MAERRVFDGAHLRATLLDLDGAPPDRRPLMVTFDFRKAGGKNGFDTASRANTFQRRGYAHLSVQTRANDWFINPDTAALEAALPGIVSAFGEVRMLGYSMGGYGAFRFAGAAGARRVVAVSPQVSIDPRVVPFDLRYRSEAAGFDRVAGDLGRVRMDDLRGLILLDPFVRADLRHGRMLQRLFPGLRLARLNFAGHPANRVLRDGGRGWAVQAAASEAEQGTFVVQDAHRAARRQSWRYWRGIAAKAGTRRPELAEVGLHEAARLHPSAGQ